VSQQTWQTFWFTTPFQESAGTIWIALLNDTTGVIRTYYAAGSSGDSVTSTTVNYTTPTTWGTATNQTFAYSCRADEVTYPIVQPTLFGWQDPMPSASRSTIANNLLLGGAFTGMPASGTIDRIDAVLDAPGGSGGQTQVMRMALYADNGSNTATGAALGTSAEVTVTNSQPIDWVRFTFAAPIAVTNGTIYHAEIFTGTTSAISAGYWTTAASGASKFVAATYAATAPTYPGGSAGLTRLYAIRVNLTATTTSTKLSDPAVTPTSAAGAGVLLTASTAGVYYGSPVPSVTGQWKRDGVDIAGQTGTTYTTAAGDVGKTVTYVETATNTGGSVTGTSNGVAVPAAGASSGKNVLMMGVG
jgi:hypothetical protein